MTLIADGDRGSRLVVHPGAGHGGIAPFHEEPAPRVVGPLGR